MKNALFQLSAEMKKAGLTSTVEVRLHARMPIISFQVIPDFGLPFRLLVDTMVLLTCSYSLAEVRYWIQ